MVQDPAHKILTLANCLRRSRILQFGEHLSASMYLQVLRGRVSIPALLRKDPQSIKHVIELSAKDCRDVLHQHNFHLTALVLEAVSKMEKAFICRDNTQVTACDRVAHMMGVMFFLRAWVAWLHHKKVQGMWKRCPTQQTCQAIELNCHSFLSIFRFCHHHNLPLRLWDISTQRNEGYHRKVRSYGSSGTFTSHITLLEFERLQPVLTHATVAVAENKDLDARSKRIPDDVAASDFGRELVSCDGCSEEKLQAAILGHDGLGWAKNALQRLSVDFSDGFDESCFHSPIIGNESVDPATVLSDALVPEGKGLEIVLQDDGKDSDDELHEGDDRPSPGNMDDRLNLQGSYCYVKVYAGSHVLYVVDQLDMLILEKRPSVKLDGKEFINLEQFIKEYISERWSSFLSTDRLQRVRGPEEVKMFGRRCVDLNR